LLDTMTAGASNDIERAVEIARRMVSEFGMSPLGPIHLGKPEDPHSQSLLDRIEQATNEIVTAQLRRACEIVDARREEIARLSAGLLERDTLDAEEIHECFGIQTAETVA
jgi:cell division protease FtsH